MAEQALEKQRSINSPLKSKRILWREPENPIRWAYAKLLREQSNTKKLYDINPYAEVYRFRDNVYGIYTESLDGMGDPWMYLVVGPEKAMLIDTGFGAGDLKGLVEEIIDIDLKADVFGFHLDTDYLFELSDIGAAFQIESCNIHFRFLGHWIFSVLAPETVSG